MKITQFILVASIKAIDLRLKDNQQNEMAITLYWGNVMGVEDPLLLFSNALALFYAYFNDTVWENVSHEGFAFLVLQ